MEKKEPFWPSEKSFILIAMTRAMNVRYVPRIIFSFFFDQIERSQAMALF